MRRLLPIGGAPGTGELAEKISSMLYRYHLNSGRAHDIMALPMAIMILTEVQKWMDEQKEESKMGTNKYAETEKVIRPLGDRVLVRREKAEKITAGGIHIPDSAQEKTTIGVVIATGPGKFLDSGRFVEVVVKKGDRVIFGRYSGQEDRSQQDVIILREDDILGIFE